jgi:hypothetical protein
LIALNEIGSGLQLLSHNPNWIGAFKPQYYYLKICSRKQSSIYLSETLATGYQICCMCEFETSHNKCPFVSFLTRISEGKVLFSSFIELIFCWDHFQRDPELL